VGEWSDANPDTYIKDVGWDSGAGIGRYEEKNFFLSLPGFFFRTPDHPARFLLAIQTEPLSGIQ
jgi:hypothetical protein